MKRFQITAAIAAAFSLTLPAIAQVGPGDALLMMNASSGSGFEIIDTSTGSLTPITGIPAAFQHTDAGLIDPVTGDIWAAGTGAEKYTVFRMTLAGSTMAAMVPVADLSGLPMGSGPHNGIVAMELDRDGNVFVMESGTLWRIDRHTFAVTEWSTDLGDIGNALVMVPETNTLWTCSRGADGNPFPDARISRFQVDQGPNTGAQILPLAFFGVDTRVTSMAFDGDETLYFGTLGEMLYYKTTTGSFNNMNLTGSQDNFNSLDFDRVTGLLHTAGGDNALNTYAVVDPVALTSTSIESSHECLPGGNPADPTCANADQNSSVYVNDFMDTTQMFPRVASRSAGFNLEISSNGKVGDFSVIAVVEINGVPFANPIVLGPFGTIGTGGNFVYQGAAPAGYIPSAITSLGFGTATFDFVTAQFTLGGVATLDLVP